jgi:hypothetical protein
MTEKNVTETRTISTRVTTLMYGELLSFLVKNAHINVADYLRDLIRQDLERHRGIIDKIESRDAR